MGDDRRKDNHKRKIETKKAEYFWEMWRKRLAFS